MRGVDYMRSIFGEINEEHKRGISSSRGAFLAAALVVVQELESPLKEETLVRLAVMELDAESACPETRRAFG
jgi:hypothetical protein